MRAQDGRMRILSENLANADSTGSTAGGDPSRRKIPTFSNPEAPIANPYTTQKSKTL